MRRKRGMMSIDLLFALIFLTFLIMWIQDYSLYALDNSDAFGVQVQLDGKAIDLGSQVNTFSILNPSGTDYLVLDTSPVKKFAYNDTNATIAIASNSLRVTALGTSSSYPVVSGLSYDQVSKKVT